VAAFVGQLQRTLHSALSSICDTSTSSTSSVKEVLKLALVGARTTKRLVVKSDSFVGIWDPTLWTILHSRLLAHGRFAGLGGMCKEVISLAQTLHTSLNIGKSRRDGVTVTSKRKADTDSGARAGEKRTKRMVSTTKSRRDDGSGAKISS
jgi:DNA polymerase phi